MNNFNRVITYGTFDTFHYGHLELLRRAKSLGDYLIVAISTDDFNLKKGKKCVFSFNQRKEWVKHIKYVDLTIEEASWDQKIQDVQKFNVNTFVIGDDWEGRFDFLKEYCEVLYLPRTEDISTTQIKKLL